MTTIYYGLFCIGIFLIIVWAFKNDDYDEFYDGSKDKRFSINKARNLQAAKQKKDGIDN